LDFSKLNLEEAQGLQLEITEEGEQTEIVPQEETQE